jgi:peptidyl-prolyl cis-trans isomerase A (cyclophilin A)
MEYGMRAQVIPGFKEGISMLNVGGKAKLIIPPYLGYGEAGAGNVIPPNSWIIFDVEIISAE